MAGFDLGHGAGPRRSVDVDIQPIPMIDLMMVMISFLLITAVWSHMARTDVSANAPGQDHPMTTPLARKVLHLEVKDEAFVLSWREGANVVQRTEVPRRAEERQEGALRVVRYPELATQLRSTWESNGIHRDATDRVLDRAVLHTTNSLPYGDMIAVLDAMHGVKRPVHGRPGGAFEVTFAVD